METKESRPESSKTIRLASLALCAIAIAFLQFNAPPAAADELDTNNCSGHLECLYFASGYSNANTNLPGATTWDLEPVISEPENTEGGPWQGTFRIIQHRTVNMESETLCLEATTIFRETATLDACDDSPEQRWYFEPHGEWLITDASKPNAYSPWWPDGANWTSESHYDTKFYIRSAGKNYTNRCYGSTSDGLLTNLFGTTARLDGCGNGFDLNDDYYGFNFYSFNRSDRARKTDEQKKELTRFFVSSILKHSMAVCNRNPARCQTQLSDPNTGTALTDWNRVNQIVINREPESVVKPIGCAGSDGAGGTAQTIYNAGNSDMNTTISASGTSEFSESFTNSLSIEVGTEIEVGFFTASMKVTTSREWGKTWSESKTLSQAVSWTIPPLRYATAVLAARAVQAKAKWKFGTGDFHDWETDVTPELSIPYSKSANSVSPDTVLAIYNSHGPKGCDATLPSTMDPDQIIEVTNVTDPGKSPVPGDRLEAHADPTWWSVPEGDSTPVNLRYQWYRQRGGEPPVLIPGARSSHYTVTRNDLTDPELIPRMGRYRLFIGVTDVAGTGRFDSFESTSISTPSVVAEHEENHTNLGLSVVNPETDTSSEVVVDITASAPLLDTSPQGDVDLLSDGTQIKRVTLGPGGKARTRFRLPRGNHQLEAVFDGSGPFSGSVSNVVPVRITGIPSKVELSIDRRYIDQGSVSKATAQVEGTRGQEASGTVRFTVDGNQVGAPTQLNDGEATVQLPVPEEPENRRIQAIYSGDSMLDGAESESLEQRVKALPDEEPETIEPELVPTEASVSVNRRVTHRNGQVRFETQVRSKKGAAPSGKVQFLLDGVQVGPPLKLDPSGRASWRTNEAFLVGKRTLRVEFQLPPEYSSPPAAKAELEVRRHGVRVALSLKRQRVQRGARVRLTGRLLPDSRQVKFGRPTVDLHLGGRKLKTVRVNSQGRFRFGFKASRLALGRQNLEVRYRGNPLRSIAPASSTVAILRR